MRFEHINTVFEDSIKRLLATDLTSEPIRQITFTDEPKFPEYFCFPKKIGAENKVSKFQGRGLSKSHSLSKLKAIAECIERMALYYPHREFSKLKFSDNGLMIDPADFVNFSNEQLGGEREKYIKEVRESEFFWEKAFDYSNNKECLIPAQSVYLSLNFSDEPPLREQNTNGAAFGFTFEDAFVKGLLELIERDAFIVSYLKKISPPRIDYSNSQDLYNLSKYFKRYNLEFNLFDITSDIDIPVVMAVNLDRTDIGPAFNIGACADFDMEAAAIKASYESVMARNSFRLSKEVEGIPDITPDKIMDEEDRGYYWYPTKRLDDIEFLLSSKETVSLEPSIQIHPDKKLHYVLSELSRNKYRVIATNVSQPEISKKKWYVVKALVPELHPLYLSEEFKALHSVHAGTIKNLNLLPHPFL